MTPYIRMLLAMYDYEQLEREGRLPEREESCNPPTCAACGNTKNLLGREVPELYDGVSYWHCPCGAVTDRWTDKLV